MNSINTQTDGKRIYNASSLVRRDSRAFKYFLFLPISYRDGAIYRKSINEYMSKERYSKVGTMFLEAYKREQHNIILFEQKQNEEKASDPNPIKVTVPKKVKFFAWYVDFTHKIWPKSLTQKALYLLFAPIGVIWFLIGFLPIFIGSYCYKIYHKIGIKNKIKPNNNADVNRYRKNWKGTFFKEIWDAIKAFFKFNSRFSDKTIDYWYANDRYRNLLGKETLVIDKIITEPSVKEELPKEAMASSSVGEFYMCTENDIDQDELLKATISYEEACRQLEQGGVKTSSLSKEEIIHYWNQLQSANFRLIDNKLATFADPHGTASKELIPIIRILFPKLPIVGIQGVKINLQVKERQKGFCDHAEVVFVLPEKNTMYIVEPKSTNTITPESPPDFLPHEMIELGVQNNYLSTSCVTFSSAIMLVLSNSICNKINDVESLKARLSELRSLDLLEYIEDQCVS